MVCGIAGNVAGKTTEAEKGQTGENAENGRYSLEIAVETEKEVEIGIHCENAGFNAETGAQEDGEIPVGIEVRLRV